MRRSTMTPHETPKLTCSRQCHADVALACFNRAWVTLGITVRLSQILELQKEKKCATVNEDYIRRGLFWVMYMVDRYLSVSLGRPLAIRDEDVTTHLPSDENLLGFNELGETELKILIGVSVHAR